MGSLRLNTLANYGGQVVAAIIGYAVVPIYLRFLGHEGYGMVGFLLVLQSSLAVLDLGLGMTATREVGRLTGQADGARESRHLLRTLEVWYGFMAIVIVTGLVAGSGAMARHWFKADTLRPETLHDCLLAAAATIGLRWPVALYSGVLRGREQQVRLNAISSAVSIGKAVVSIGVLAFVSPDVVAFYLVQVGAAMVELLLMARAAWGSVGGRTVEPARFRRALLARVWGFSFKLAVISGCAMLLKQVDRWAVSALLPIEQLGYYTNAVLLGMGISRVFNPVQNAVFPRLSRLLAGDETAELAETFHRSCQCIMALVAPVTALVAGLSADVLHFWLRAGDPAGAAASAGAAPLAITALAMLFNSAMAIPYSIQIAAGHTALPIWTNSLGAALLVPLSFVMVRQWGLAGAAYAWLAFNVLYYTIVPHFLFSRVLPGHKARWYLRDTLPFIVAGLGLAATFRWLNLGVDGPVLRAVSVAVLLAGYALIVWLLLPEVRGLVARVPFVRPVLSKPRY